MDKYAEEDLPMNIKSSYLGLKPSSSNAADLNNFLLKVGQHKNDFSFVRGVVRQYAEKENTPLQNDVNYGYTEEIAHNLRDDSNYIPESRYASPQQSKLTNEKRCRRELWWLSNNQKIVKPKRQIQQIALVNKNPQHISGGRRRVEKAIKTNERDNKRRYLGSEPFSNRPLIQPDSYESVDAYEFDDRPPNNQMESGPHAGGRSYNFMPQINPMDTPNENRRGDDLAPNQALPVAAYDNGMNTADVPQDYRSFMPVAEYQNNAPPDNYNFRSPPYADPEVSGSPVYSMNPSHNLNPDATFLDSYQPAEINQMNPMPPGQPVVSKPINQVNQANMMNRANGAVNQINQPNGVNQPKFRSQQQVNNPKGNSLYSVDAGQEDKIDTFAPYQPSQEDIENGRLLQSAYNPPLQFQLVNGENYPAVFRPNDKNPMVVDQTLQNNNFHPENAPNMPMAAYGSRGLRARRTPTHKPLADINDIIKEKMQMGHQLQSKKRRQFKARHRKFKHNNEEDEDKHYYKFRHHYREKRQVVVWTTTEGDKWNVTTFLSRRLQSIDDVNFDQNVYNEVVSQRSPRDFLSDLSNEEDFAEDNPFKDEMKINNTLISDDKRIGRHPTRNATTERYATPGLKDGTALDKEEQQKNAENVQEISDILCENQLQSTQLPEHIQAIEKRNDRFTKVSDFDDVIENSNLTSSSELKLQKREKDPLSKQNDGIVRFDKVSDFDDITESTKHVNIRKVRQALNMSSEPDPYNRKLPRFRRTRHHLMKRKKLRPDDAEESERQKSLVITTDISNTDVKKLEAPPLTAEKRDQLADYENDRIAKMMNGEVSSQIVSSVFAAVCQRLALKKKFFSGLSRKNSNSDKTCLLEHDKDVVFNCNPKARNLLEQLAGVVNEFIDKQIARGACRHLPAVLRDFLGYMLSQKRPRKEDETCQHQTHSEDSTFRQAPVECTHPPALPPEERVNDNAVLYSSYRSTLEHLEDLLDDYRRLSPKSKEKAKYIKNYIEDNVNALLNVISKERRRSENEQLTTPVYRKKLVAPLETDPDLLVQQALANVDNFVGKNNDLLVKNDLISTVGQHSYLSNNNNNNQKKKLKRDTSKKFAESDQYIRLQNAVEEYRAKRENEKKIGEIFGDSPHLQVKSEVSYEEPLVYTIE